MRPGDKVYVKDVHENKVLRVVVALDGGMVFVSRPQEVEQSKRERREPNCIGFRPSDVSQRKNHN
jgi:hypothetical protein